MSDEQLQQQLLKMNETLQEVKMEQVRLRQLIEDNIKEQERKYELWEKCTGNCASHRKGIWDAIDALRKDVFQAIDELRRKLATVAEDGVGATTKAAITWALVSVFITGAIGTGVVLILNHIAAGIKGGKP